MDFAYDESNRLLNAGGIPYDWDLNGNLLSDGSSTYSYNHANLLIGVSEAQSSATFAYNGLGDRLQQTVGGVTTNYVLDINNSLTQVFSDGTDRYLYGMGRLAQQAPNGLQYFLPDALGSVRQLADPSGGIILAQSFDPYGGLLSSQGAAASPYGFAGEWGDPSGLLYLRARYYLPQAGIFTARDPFPGLTNLPVTLQPYLYAAGNPVRYTDPSGQFVDTLFDVASFGYDIYQIANKSQRGCTIAWTDWAALGLDAFSLSIPFLPAAGGLLLRAFAHGDEAWDAIHTIRYLSELADETRYLEDASELISHTDDADIVYRVMRAEEHPNALIEGIWAKNPLKDVHPQYHVTHGNSAKTNWISTTKDLNWAKKFQIDNPIYVVDLQKVNSTIIDTTIPGVMNGWHFMARDLAKRASEVLVKAHIPPEAIIGVLFK